jgi:hypothetical protein
MKLEGEALERKLHRARMSYMTPQQRRAYHRSRECQAAGELVAHPELSSVVTNRVVVARQDLQPSRRPAGDRFPEAKTMPSNASGADDLWSLVSTEYKRDWLVELQPVNAQEDEDVQMVQVHDIPLPPSPVVTAPAVHAPEAYAAVVVTAGVEGEDLPALIEDAPASLHVVPPSPAAPSSVVTAPAVHAPEACAAVVGTAGVEVEDLPALVVDAPASLHVVPPSPVARADTADSWTHLCRPWYMRTLVPPSTK